MQLQEAFAAGLIKPGLNSVQEVTKKRPKINNVAGLKQKLDEFRQHSHLKIPKKLMSHILLNIYSILKSRQDKMPWIERLDMVNAPAPIAPELAYAEDQGHIDTPFALPLRHLLFEIICILL